MSGADGTIAAIRTHGVAGGLHEGAKFRGCGLDQQPCQGLCGTALSHKLLVRRVRRDSVAEHSHGGMHDAQADIACRVLRHELRREGEQTAGAHFVTAV